MKRFSDIIGEDVESAVAKVLNGKCVGGYSDGGVDVIAGDLSVQVKSSAKGAIMHMAKALELRRRGIPAAFIPVVIGCPESAEKCLEALRARGWFLGEGATANREQQRQLDVLASMLKGVSYG